MAQGDRWIYQVDNNGTSSIHQVDVGTTTTVEGQSRTSLETSTPEGTLLDVSTYASTVAAVTAFPAAANTLSMAVGPYVLLKQPAEPGDTFTQIDKTVNSGIDADGDGVSEQVTLLSTVQVAERAPLSTPAGAFSNALRLRTTTLQTVAYSRTNSRTTTQFVSNDWYVSRVGIVRSDLVTSIGGQQLSSSSMVLLAYHVGEARGGAAPAITSVAPGDAQVHNGGVAVTAGFNFPMDTASLNAGGFVVSDSQGTAITGSVAVAPNGLSATFIPAPGWHSDTYTAKVTALATDRVGNGATPRAWNFTLDTVAPILALASPADGATGVATAARLSFTFSEAIDPATVVTSATPLVTITNDTTGLAAPATFSFDGKSTIGFAPNKYWQHDQSYTVTFPSSIADMVSNALGAESKVRFSTVPSVFAQPTTLAATMGRQPTVAFGDVDGDGLTDVLWAAWDDSTFPWQVRLYVRRGQADGTWAGAVEPMAAPVYPCSVFTIAIGDTNADGRNDLVLGGSCGIRVLVQDSSGHFSAGPVYPLPGYDYGGVIQLVDINGDGRLDMLSAGNSTAFRVWIQTSSGTFTETALIETGLGSLTGLAVADLDGDGLKDVVASSVGSQAQRLAVLKGMAGGGFGPPAVLQTGDGWPSSVAIGDIDADGRLDLVASIQYGEIPRVLVLRQGADHLFSLSATIQLSEPAQGVALLDADADGRLDLIVGHNDSFSVMKPLGDGRFGAEDFYWVPPPPTGTDWSMAVGPRDAQGRGMIEFNGQVFAPRTPAQPNQASSFKRTADQSSLKGPLRFSATRSIPLSRTASPQ